ncbi:MAG TPA: hypothetical protein VF713_19495, partial [Thermoanaerobaculia bacterium]
VDLRPDRPQLLDHILGRRFLLCGHASASLSLSVRAMILSERRFALSERATAIITRAIRCHVRAIEIFEFVTAMYVRAFAI